MYIFNFFLIQPTMIIFMIPSFPFKYFPPTPIIIIYPSINPIQINLIYFVSIKYLSKTKTSINL